MYTTWWMCALNPDRYPNRPWCKSCVWAHQGKRYYIRDISVVTASNNGKNIKSVNCLQMEISHILQNLHDSLVTPKDLAQKYSCLFLSNMLLKAQVAITTNCTLSRTRSTHPWLLPTPFLTPPSFHSALKLLSLPSSELWWAGNPPMVGMGKHRPSLQCCWLSTNYRTARAPFAIGDYCFTALRVIARGSQPSGSKGKIEPYVIISIGGWGN